MSALDEFLRSRNWSFNAIIENGKLTYKNAEWIGDAIPYIKAAAELAALREENKRLRKAIAKAQEELRSTAQNWQEQCLFDCDDILSAALAETEQEQTPKEHEHDFTESIHCSICGKSLF